MTHVIQINADGSAEAMHNDGMSLAFLGAQYIERATEIKFDAITQKWEIWAPNTYTHRVFERIYFSPACGFDTYEGARQVEVAWLNACRLGGIPPQSESGLQILAAARAGLES